MPVLPGTDHPGFGVNTQVTVKLLGEGSRKRFCARREKCCKIAANSHRMELQMLGS